MTATENLSTSTISGMDGLFIKSMIAVGVILTAAILLFAGLGHYALWDDEAINALHAMGVWRTGDTTAIVGDNIVGYREGAPLVGLRERYTPPLGFYLAAPSLGLVGQTAFAARLPFAMCGLGTVVVLILGLKKAHADLTTWILMAEAILGNVSFFLFCRQCRYYGAAILLTSTLAALYVFRGGRTRSVVAFAVLSVLLLAANYLNYVAFYGCLAADYLIWGRKRRPPKARDWLWLILPQVLLGAPIVLTWNPLGKDVINYRTANWLAEKATLFWWNWRDLNRCEFGAVLLMVLAPLIFVRFRQVGLLRLPLAAFLYVGVVTMISPQPVGKTVVADIRYLAPIIPLCLTIEVLCLRAIAPKPILAALMGLVVFGTNLLNGGPLILWGLRSTIVSYVNELVHPPGDPYTATADWINEHVPAGCSVWVQPDFKVYPLMFHAPKVIYAWQLPAPPAHQFKSLPAIHFRGVESPDFVVAFGPAAKALAPQLESPRHTKFRYEHAAMIDMFWAELHRPEMVQHRFKRFDVRDPATEAIHVFRRVEPPITAPHNPAAGHE